MTGDIEFIVRHHAAVVEVGRADGEKDIITNTYLGVDIDRFVVPGPIGKPLSLEDLFVSTGGQC